MRIIKHTTIIETKIRDNVVATATVGEKFLSLGDLVWIHHIQTRPTLEEIEATILFFNEVRDEIIDLQNRLCLLYNESHS